MTTRQQDLFPMIREAQRALAFSFAAEPPRPKPSGPAKVALTGGAIALLQGLARGDFGLYSKAGKFEKPFAAPGKELMRLGLVRMGRELAPEQWSWDLSEKGRAWLAG